MTKSSELFVAGSALSCELGPIERTSLYGENSERYEARLEFVLQQCDISLWLALGYPPSGMRGYWRLHLRIEHPEYYDPNWRDLYPNAR